MKKWVLFIVIFALSALSAVERSIWIDCRNSNWQEQAKEEFRKKPECRSLELYLPGSGDVELPERDFTRISIDGWNDGYTFQLAKLGKYKLTELKLNGGTVGGWNTLVQPELKVLKADSVYVDAAELAQAKLPELRKLVIYHIKGKVLDLRGMPKLEYLTFHSCDDGLQILLHPDCKLKYLRLPKKTSHLLPELDLSHLEHLVTHESWESNAVRLPKLKELTMLYWEKKMVELPPLPELEELLIYYGGEVSLANVKAQCPKLRELALWTVDNVYDWEALPQLKIKRLWVQDIPGVKYSLPVAAPEGCRVDGLPSFIENPYKMWSAWSVAVMALAAWTWWYQRKRQQEES